METCHSIVCNLVKNRFLTLFVLMYAYIHARNIVKLTLTDRSES